MIQPDGWRRKTTSSLLPTIVLVRWPRATSATDRVASKSTGDSVMKPSEQNAARRRSQPGMSSATLARVTKTSGAGAGMTSGAQAPTLTLAPTPASIAARSRAAASGGRDSGALRGAVCVTDA